MIVSGFLVVDTAGAFILPLKYRVINTWWPYIQRYAERYGVDPRFVAAHMYQESRGNPYAISNVGAIGLMQVMPKTGIGICGYSINDLKEPLKNIECGTRYIAEMYKQFKDYRWVAAGYYGGPGTPPTSTKGSPPVYQYVNDVMAHYKNISETGVIV